MTNDPGRKDDQAKTRLELLSPTWLYGVGDVLTFGAKKYAAHNWRKGIAISRLLGAALRHLLSFMGGQDCDPETGLNHLLHASCCLMFAYETWLMRKEFDDRWKPDGRGTAIPNDDLPKVAPGVLTSDSPGGGTVSQTDR